MHDRRAGSHTGRSGGYDAPRTDHPGAYGDAFADVYDSWYGDVSDTDATVSGVLALAGDRPTLELGVGTGRIALPLARAGLGVVGLDASAAMLAELSGKQARCRERVMPILADMAALPLATASVGTVFAAFNTFFNLADEAAQRGCLAEIARVLAPGGHGIVEAFVPSPDPVPDRGVSVRDVSDESVTVVTSRHDPGEQIMAGEHVEVRPGSVHRRPWRIRYATTAQLDAMAAGAGLTLVRRTSSWSGDAFTETSDVHVSLYRRGPSGAD